MGFASDSLPTGFAANRRAVPHAPGIARCVIRNTLENRPSVRPPFGRDLNRHSIKEPPCAESLRSCSLPRSPRSQAERRRRRPRPSRPLQPRSWTRRSTRCRCIPSALSSSGYTACARLLRLCRRHQWNRRVTGRTNGARTGTALRSGSDRCTGSMRSGWVSRKP